ncbi:MULTISPECIES: GNAT family N-acetyltransferase [Terribacillus]|uniref:N-acetyltransferase domain-containing protein n=1 Tax=Terribacillus saccharophilus TaxID=361277 RepID=A0ABX4GUQ3_9BACI|nr:MULTISPECIES: GNAT family N-acetyltransferase [Terribacillus]PAD34261.1 hypothetical protein CHH56_15425 [Terribacillus saccharophilus]PAD94838.1 hypothetical protein CHH50_16515 [Terribacillus saccharophilus]PAD98587.1 hypothetical protein CHH48_16525 [Terribacillus saccharophilus]
MNKMFIELAIRNSNPEYNLVSRNRKTITIGDIKTEFVKAQSYNMSRMLIKNDHKYIGIVDFTMKNPLDNTPWIESFVIHKKFQGSNTSKQAYDYFESMLRRQTNTCRLAVYKRNKSAVCFWGEMGYTPYEEEVSEGKVCLLMEKRY